MPRLLLSLLVLLLLARTAAAQEDAVVRGVVVNSATGEPVVEALVAVGAERRASTDGEGRFTLCRLADGPARVRVWKAFHAEQEVSVELTPGDTAQVSVELRGADRRRLRPDNDALPEALLVVDGVPVFHSWSGCETAPPGMRALPALDPEDVESVVVLKGREAVARYGPDARHGAVVVTTDRRAERPVP